MRTQPQQTQALAEQFRTLGASITGGMEPAVALARVTTLAQRWIPACDWCAITQAGRQPRTLAASDDVARAIDAVQIAAGEGPCLSAARDDTVIQVHDLRTETRWPDFIRGALATTPVRSVLTFQLHPERARSALNFYSSRPGAFDAENVSVAVFFAALAQSAVLHLNAQTHSVNLERALTTSRLIGAAVGIMMSTHKITEDDAFELLRTSSQELNRKLADIAAEVTETGTLP